MIFLFILDYERIVYYVKHACFNDFPQAVFIGQKKKRKKTSQVVLQIEVERYTSPSIYEKKLKKLSGQKMALLSAMITLAHQHGSKNSL